MSLFPFQFVERVSQRPFRAIQDDADLRVLDSKIDVVTNESTGCIHRFDVSRAAEEDVVVFAGDTVTVDELRDIVDSFLKTETR